MRLAKLALVGCLAVSGQGASWGGVWRWSLAALAAGHTADLASSRGRLEANPLLRGPGGRFSLGRGIALKAGLTGAFAILEWRMVKRRPELAKPFAITNLVATGAMGGVAIRNTRLGKP